MRFLPTLLVLTVFASAIAPAAAGTKHHHHAAAAAHEAETQAQHRIRLAAKEKKAWHEHLAKLRTLPHSERIAEKHHEKLWQRKHNVKVAEMQGETEHEKRAQLHAEKLVRRHHHRIEALMAGVPKSAPKRSLVHARHLQALAAAHQENAVHRAALAQTRIARRQAIHALHQAKFAALFHAHLVNVQALHNARVAAGRAHWAALHGDDSSGKNIRFWETGAAGVPVKVISVDLNDPNVKVSAVMAARGNGTAEPFRQMISRANPNVAVTGTFFSLDDLQPVGDIVIDGSLVHFGGMGTALCITPSNHATMVTCQWGRHHDWSPFDFVVACGPRLLHEGRVVLDARAERFHDRHMLAPNSRIAVGITPGNTLFFVMTHSPIYLGKLARVMQSLGAAEAMNLDAGTSTGFYYNGATLAKPGRKLTNMIVVYGRRDRYEHALDQLVPSAYHRAAQRRPLSGARTAALVRP
ncbi:MAG: phosphodiester glycosidase family protein [Janthinobacterium lividum]